MIEAISMCRRLIYWTRSEVKKALATVFPKPFDIPGPKEQLLQGLVCGRQSGKNTAHLPDGANRSFVRLEFFPLVKSSGAG